MTIFGENAKNNLLTLLLKTHTIPYIPKGGWMANERINYNQRFVFSICADGLKKYVYFNTRKQIGQKRKGFCAS